MPISEDLRNLLDLLEKGTEQENLEWERTPSDNVFRVELPGGASVRITMDEYSTPEEVQRVRYVLSLVNSDGRLMEEWTSEDLDAEAGRLHSLFRIARRSANRYYKEVKQILDNLNALVGSKGGKG